MDEIIAAAREHKVDAVTIAGDIFDSADTTHEERDMLLRKLMILDTICDVYMIPGNHDLVDTRVTTIHYLAMLSKSGKFKRTTVVEKTSLVQQGDTLYVLLVSDGKNYRKDLKAILKEIREASLQLNHKHTVVVTHQTVKGSLTGTGYRLPKGVRIKPNQQVTYYALGDIHVHQSVGPAAFYPGSPVQTEFDEDTNKGVLIVDTNDPKHPLFHPIKSRKFVVVKSSDTKKLEELRGSDAHVKVVRDGVSKRGKNEVDIDGDNVVKVEHAKTSVDTTELKSSGKVRDDLKLALRKRYKLTKTQVRFGLGLLDGNGKSAETSNE